MSKCLSCPSLAFQKSFDSEVIGQWWCESYGMKIEDRRSLYKPPVPICIPKGEVVVKSG